MSEMKNYAMDLEAAVLSAIEENGAETLEDVISEVRLKYVFVILSSIFQSSIFKICQATDHVSSSH